MDTLPLRGLHRFDLPRRDRDPGRIRAVAQGHIDGVSANALSRLTQEIRERGITDVWMDGSNLGAAVATVKKRCPDVSVTTFFHNCEARFFLGAFRHSPSVRAAGVLLANYRAEQMATKHSDRIVCISDRDSGMLESLYGRGADAILPMALHDQMHGPGAEPGKARAEPYALFVGGDFYANRRGIEWFVDHVAADIPLRTLVVGRGFERSKAHLERSGNVEVVGAVDDLGPYYRFATIVIAPIFDGSGMKTKVAEALMHGKRVVGTPEAFSGYECVVDRAGRVCRDASDFRQAIADESDRSSNLFNPELRELYREHFSPQAVRTRLSAILNS
jgi:glycosyltransferase involved in cell wall biosynthesis